MKLFRLVLSVFALFITLQTPVTAWAEVETGYHGVQLAVDPWWSPKKYFGGDSQPESKPLLKPLETEKPAKAAKESSEKEKKSFLENMGFFMKAEEETRKADKEVSTLVPQTTAVEEEKTKEKGKKSSADTSAIAVEPLNLKPSEGVVVETTKGKMYMMLYPNEAPVTVRNFLSLVDKGFYNTPAMKFHRVVPGFVVQTGDPTGSGMGGSGKRIPLEVKNKLTHKYKGTVAMARGPDPNSATSQFYITVAPQPFLDGKYAIFGQVIKGLDVLEKIEKDDLVLSVQRADLSTIETDAELPKDGFMASFINYFKPSK